jgi:mevalonate kinase
MSKVKAAKMGGFHSKILLFGEYSIIQDSMGLSIPYDSFRGTLSYITPDNRTASREESNESLKTYAAYLRELNDKGTFVAKFDIDRLEQDIANGLYFDSTIPQGFGVGSSGALVAALYDHYAINKFEPENVTGENLQQLKKIFSQMESFFHGTSSGMDPLICYIDLPVLMKSKTDIGTVDLPEDISAGPGAIFLLDTGRPGRTQPLVQYFLDKCKEKDFVDLCKSKFIPYNDQCIKDFLKGETKSLFYNLYHLSKFLLDNLTPMVPKLFREVWMQGLETKAYYLKLCGSGGGGFILGFTEDLEKAKGLLKDHQIKVIKRF